MKTAVRKLGIKVIQSGPYSYSSAPIENLFSVIKLNEINEDGQPTGKRSLHHIRNMVLKRLRRVPVSTRVAYWHHSTGHLYRHVCFDKI